VVEAAGIRDILTKSLGSSNILNVVKATMQALNELKDPAEEAARRGVPLHKVQPFWMQEREHE
jgi:small subunit ribosomal protein S5